MGKHFWQPYHVWNWSYPFEDSLPVPNYLFVTWMRYSRRWDDQVGVTFSILVCLFTFLSLNSFSVFPDNPTKCKFLSDDEKIIAVKVMRGGSIVSCFTIDLRAISGCGQTIKDSRINSSNCSRHSK